MRLINRQAIKHISIKKGSGVFFIGCLLCLLAILMTILYVETSNAMYSSTVAMTRSDIIADSSAVFSQSYDYNYNQDQARTMGTLLTDLNNDCNSRYEISSSVYFPAENEIAVDCTAKAKSSYTSLTGVDYYASTKTSVVRSVDIYGDVMVIP